MNCERCKGESYKGYDYPQRGNGCLLMCVGLLLAPLLIGLPIIIYGDSLRDTASGLWICKGCGSTTPRAIQAGEIGRGCLGWFVVASAVMAGVAVLLAFYVPK